MEAMLVSTDELCHYGTKRHSGRYPYGSGEHPFQHDGNFLAEVKDMRSEGLTEKEIAHYFGLRTRDLRSAITLANKNEKTAKRAEVLKYSEQGMSVSEISKKTGMPWSTVKSYIQQEEQRKTDVTQATIDVLKKNVDEKGYVDIGKGVASGLGITENRLDAAVYALKQEGYETYLIHVPQAFVPDAYTKVRVLAKPGIEYKDVYLNRDKIGIVNERFKDPNGTELETYRPVESISSKRVQVAYAEDGGGAKDGIIELRRGAEGLDLGNSRYAQVRIAVDDKYYLKGVAVYSDNLPDGVDIRFNTNKSKTKVKNDFDAMKDLKGDLSDPMTAFESMIKPGGQKGYLNIVREEGDWTTWKKSLASQMLSKQSTSIAKQQLQAKHLDYEAEFEEIKSLTNPVLKQYLLEKFADKCDRAAETLSAAAVPRQTTSVILPLTTIKPNEIYAPNYRNGETVILIRYPHGGKFEIPELKVNNNNKEAKETFENARDAVGIHPSVADRLSGADFDGDTVIVIPNNNKAFTNSPALKDLEGFDPKTAYARPETLRGETRDKVLDYISEGLSASEISKRTGVSEDTVNNYISVPPVIHKTGQTQMGVVTNLIADMTLQDPSPDELARAVKYSMVIIDAEKHDLDYRQARKDFDIAGLQKKYQKHKDDDGYGGASTLISRANAKTRVPKVKKSYKPDPETGRYTYSPAKDQVWVNEKTGKTGVKRTKLPQMRLVDNAYELSSGTAMEAVYADYANDMMRLGGRARKEAAATHIPSKDPEAAKKYATEVTSLKAKIEEAKSNSPYERKAQTLTDTYMVMLEAENPDLTSEQKKKYKSQALADARASLGGPKPTIDITDREWEAIQANAISKTQMNEILKRTDQDALKERAMPKEKKKMTDSKILRAKARLKQGYTLSEVADMLGVSTSTLQRALYE